MGIYWQWYYGTGADPAQSKVGPVQLMPLPNGTQTGGAWTPEDPAVLVGQLEITLRSGNPFRAPGVFVGPGTIRGLSCRAR